MKIKILSILIFFSAAIFVSAQENVNIIPLNELHPEHSRTIINVPDIDGYKTLKGDFHMHTIFSDGIVWPTTRVIEAWEEGLDAIAITDHLENHPSKKDICGDDNSSYEIALEAANERNILLVKGSEITRSMPPGHFNALFIKDANKLDVEKPIDAIMNAHEQGAFIIWNHPGWTAQQPDTCKRFDIHNELIEKGIINGIEVFNEKEWYQVVLHWCIEDKLTVFSNSDIHDINSHYYPLDDYHRPMTLIFSKERTLEGLEESLRSQMTVAWFSKYVAGREDLLRQLYQKSIITETLKAKTSKGQTLVEITNNTDFYFEFEAVEEDMPSFTIAPNSVFLLRLSDKQAGKEEIDFTLKNWYVDMLKNLTVTVSL